jgi:hypothetical protein
VCVSNIVPKVFSRLNHLKLPFSSLCYYVDKNISFLNLFVKMCYTKYKISAQI